MSLLPVEPAWRLADRAAEQRWLVTGLWSEQAVGIIGGEPKCCKSFLALDLAVAVAAGVPRLRRFGVPRAGRVLLYAAENALHISGAVLKTPALVAGLDDVAMVGEAVEERGGHLWIAEYARPLAERPSLSFRDAAALPMCFLSAFAARYGSVQAGDTVYIPPT